MKYRLLLLLIILTYSAKSQKNVFRDDIIPNIVIFKTKVDLSSVKNAKFLDYINKVKVQKPERRFPMAKKPQRKFNKFNQPLVDLTKIYALKISKGLSPLEISKQMSKFDEVIYAQPYYIPQLFYTPNDPYAASQYQLSRINAYAGWDITKGDSTIIIGITDTGTDIDHEDLQNQIAYNLNDPPNGVDDDYDGFIDNFRGWDLGENDNNPQWDENNTPGENPHGVYVSGLACARTDNGIGIAGTGFKTKFMPIKISNEWGSLNMAYEGIIYAADHGCSIINCSWGGVSGHPYGQDVINYATFNKNVLVVAAAGNNNNDIPFYPASYQNVISVAGTNPWDGRWTGSSYGIFIDVNAPGDNVFLLFPDNHYTDGGQYSGGWGTSFASPQVAALAGLIKWHYPDTLSALQIGEILKVTAKNIDNVPTNITYAGMLGAGLIDCGKALTDDSIKPSIQYRDILYNGQDTTYFGDNDTVEITGNFINYLTPATNVKVKMTSSSPYIQILTGDFTAGSIATLDSVANNGSPFRFVVVSGTPYDQIIDLKFTFTDTANYYTGFQYVRITVNPSYININPNNITTTITTNGRVGYNSPPMQGKGFIYNSYAESILYESGLLIGHSSIQVSDCVRGGDDFLPISSPVESTNPVLSEIEYSSTFNDTKVDSTKMNLFVKQTVYAWTDSTLNNTLWFNYQIINQSSNSYANLFVGIFTDWDIKDYAHNSAKYDTSSAYAYCFDKNDSSLVSGIQLLSHQSKIIYEIDNIPGGDGTIDITDGYSEDEKYFSLSHNRYDAGGTDGLDVAQVVAYGPFVLNPSDTIDLMFAYVSGTSIQNAIQSAHTNILLFDSLFAGSIGFPVQNSVTNQLLIYPNPSDNILRITGKFDKNNITDLRLIDLSGRTFFPKYTMDNNEIDIQISNLSNGLYFIKMTLKNKDMLFKFVKK